MADGFDTPEGTGSEIAVIGLAGRFPGAASVGELWSLLREGREGIAAFTEAELLAAGVTRQELEDPAYVRAGGALDGHDLFDASFFGFSPREAEITDPQHRVFLECAWQALEDAGYDASSYPGSIGVFASATLSTYLFLVQAYPEAVERVGRHRVLLGNDKDYLPTWTSYKLDLRGPSVGVNTSCSSALVAVHLACQSLLNGECDMALAGGVSIKARQRRGYRWREGGIESPDGHCRAFDARARGSVAGHGAGVVVLKRLADALADGDTVHAVIKGSAVNNDGSLKAGYTAPSEEGQARVVSEALAMADADPATIGYVEAHGTGTELGDPIEVAALARAFGGAGRGFCALGSIKTNIGHLDSAAGVAGLIKAILAVEHGVVPPSLHFETPNPQIDFASSPFYVNTALSPWPLPGSRRAGVSSFGIGGTNAHAVLEEPPPAEPSSPGRSHQLLVLSARTPETLEETGRNLAAHCRAHPDFDPADVAWTLQVGRKAFEHRRAFVFRDLADLAETLDAPNPRRVWSAVVEEPGERPVAFLFPGQGTQYPGMGRELYDEEETFRAAVDRCVGVLAPHLGLDLARLLYPAPEDEEEAARRLAETAFAQPALFTVEYALAQLWMEWGVRPQAMLGHSAGELVAACLAGVFTLEDALGLVVVRGRLIQALGGGAMLAVPLPPEELEPLLGDGLSLAAVNAPRLTVASGPAAAIEALAEELAGRGVRARRMRNSRAFHSAMMDPALAPFAAAVARVERRPPRIPYLSNVTGTWIRPEEATDPHYWARHLRQTVRFADGLGELLRAPGRVLIEIGPGATLGTLVKRHPDRRPEQAAIPSLPQDRDGGSAAAQMAGAVGRLWLAGAAVDWRGFHGGERRRRIPLPTYPFERRRYWIEPAGEELPAVQTPSPAPSALYARPGLPTVYAPPETETERQLAALWQELLGIEPVGRHDAFLELGGHSLLLVEVGARLDRAFGVRLPMRELAEAATLADLAAAVERHRAGRGEEWTGDALPVLVPAPDERHQPFPLTEVQEAYWLGRSGAFALGNVATHEYSEINVPELDLERLTRAWRRLIDRHEMLRAVVLPDGRQQILERVPPYEIETLDLRGTPQTEAEEALLEVRRRMSHQVIPADRWPLFEVRASLLPDGSTRVHLSLDLLIVDAWSVQLLFRELGFLYADPGAPLPPLELSYRDYLLADVAFRDSETFRRSLEYWRRRLPSLPGPPELPLARSPESIDSPRFARRNGRLAAEPWERLKARAAASGLTASGLLLAAFSEVLAAWSKGPRFLLNLTLFNRLPVHPQVGEVVGDFTSLVLLEVDAAGAGPFEERARRLQRRLWEDLDHRHVSGVRVLRERARSAGNAGGAAAPVVFTSLLVGTPRRGPAEPAGEPLPRADYVIGQTPQVWIDHVVGESEAGLSYFWEAVEDLFPPGLLDDMFAAYQGLLARLADEPGAWQSRPRLVPAGHLALQAAANATAAPLPDALLHTLFEEQARRDPGRPAVLSAARNLTYGELRHRAAHLGRRLHELGARPNRLVAVVLDKGWEQAAAVLGVLRSGAAYLPIDPGLPEERLLHLLRAGEVEIALTSSRLDAALPWPADVARLAVDLEEPEADPDDGPPFQGPGDLAYVIFTSGSTGSPKGVMIDHRGAVNTVLDVNRRFGIGPRDRALALSALSFDLSVWDLFGPLAAGGAVVFPEPEALRDPGRWLELIESREVTVWNSVPALMKMLADHAAETAERLPGSLRLVLLSGDWIPVSLPDQVRGLFGEIEVVSLGGATEASIWSILHPIGTVDPGWTSIPYGRPMANQGFHVLDGALEPRPLWVPGQLYIAGAGVARGYWRDAARTAASFLPDPETGGRLYRTGDLGRWLPDGTLEFLGREGFQVKVQGYRIELGEIETALAGHPRVRDAAVAAVGPARGDKRLVAWVVRAGSASSHDPRDGAPDLRDPLRVLEWKAGQPGLRHDVDGAAVALESLPTDEERRRLWRERRTFRRFLDRAVPPGALGLLLASLSQVEAEGRPKYRYPSAGGLYPVQTYVYVKPGRVEGLAGGAYYYHPRDHRLVPLAPLALDTALDPRIWDENAPVFERAAFALFLVAEMRAIAPLYAGSARDFSLLEAGYMGELLMLEAPAAGLGLCPVGTLRSEALRPLLRLEEGHVYLHGLLGGAVDPAHAEEAEREDYEHLFRLLAAAPGEQVPAETLAADNEDADLAAELRAFLGRKLPAYMVPARFLFVPALPLTANGKVDRQRLPDPETGGAGPPAEAVFAPPRTELERAVAEIWREALGVERVGLHDNFFDLGGHSVLMARVHRKLRDLLGRDLPLVDLFQYTTVSALVGHLTGETPAPAVPVSIQAAPAPAGTARTGREIAVVGMAGRFPGAPDVDRFWRNLCDGVEGIRQLSDEDLAAVGIGPEAAGAPGYVKAASFLEEADRFDADFFGYLPREAEILDPQQRVFLECAWHAMEDAGYDPGRYPGRVGVFAGSGLSVYAGNVLGRPELFESMGSVALETAVAPDYLPLRVSYKLNLKGPSVAVQTACSTSLVAIHMACQALLRGECEMALAGGVSIRGYRPAGYVWQAGVESPDGHCRTFDAAAQGTVFGSGSGVVVLKPLERALADGDRVLAVVKGTAINNDGAVKVGFTAPSVEGQATVIRAAQEAAGVTPESIGYVEAHGTATPLGDPIEVAALVRAFGDGAASPCALGSVKSNLGHTNAAAGVAGFLKAALAVAHGLLPPSLHFREPNPRIDFAGRFYVNAALAPWRTDGAPRRAGVSSFGIGGTNAHAILEEPPARQPSGPSRPWQLLVLSAKTPSALEAATDALAARFADTDLDLADAAFTLQAGRAAFAHRRVLVASGREEAAAALAGRKELATGTAAEGHRPVAFLFPGFGAQHVQMGRELYETEPVFRAEVDRCAGLLQPHLGLDVRRLLYPEPEREEEEAQRELARTGAGLPAFFTVEYALARLWMEWGIRPAAMLGHSIGEYVAACLAGVFSLPDALAVVAARGRLIEERPPGAMTSVALPAGEVEPLLGDGVSIAAVNGPALCVVSGRYGAMEELEERLRERGIEHRRLQIATAGHSPAMDPILEPFAERVGTVALRPPSIPYVSNVTGTWVEPAQATDPGYWARHLRAPVRFSEGLAALVREPGMVLLEVGPGRTLSTMARGQLEPGRPVVSSLRHPRESRSDVASMLAALGRLWIEGIEPDWAGLHRGERRLRVRLPPTPFERRRYFLDAPGAFRFGAAAAPAELEEAAALPAPVNGNGAPTSDAGEAGEIDEVEAKLLEIWRQLLGIPEIRPDQDFFELGGHSLLATRVVSRVRDVFRAELPLDAFFAAPTVSGLAAHLRGAAPAGQAPPPVEPAPREGDLPLSFAQRRLWFLDRLHPGSPAYNVHDTVLLNGPLDVAAAAAALRGIVNRHEALRTTYELRGEEPVQVIHGAMETGLPLADLTALPGPAREAEARRLSAWHARQLFDLAAGPVLRAALLRLGEREHALLLTLHHIAFDGWSWGVLYGELAALYEAFRAGRPLLRPVLPPLPVQYADYAVWQRRWIAGHVEEEQLAYWRRRLAGLKPLALPTDRPQPPAPDFRSAALQIAIPGELVDGMTSLARRHGCTLFMGLLAVFQTLLHAWTGEEDVAVGSPVAGRTRPEIEPLIGFFINTLVLRIDLSGDPEVGELLARVREGTIEAHSHQDVPFDRVVSALRADGGGEPLYRVWFVLQNTPMPTLELPGLAAVPRWGDAGAARHDLNLTLWPGDGGLVGYVEYRTELFDAPTVVRLADRFTLLLRAVLDHADQPGQRLSVLTGSVERAEEERRSARKAELKAAGLDRLQGLRRKSGAPAPEGGRR